MKVFSNEYVRVDYQEPVRLLETVWMPRSSELTEEGVFREMNRFLEFLTDYSPLRIIADTRYFGVGVHPTCNHGLYSILWLKSWKQE